VTQRGNFRQPVFAGESEYWSFLDLLMRYSEEYRNVLVGYCLMTNHYHLVVIPERDGGVSQMMRVLNSTYARRVNERLERKGHLWQARFGSTSMNLKHYRTALAYVDLNPVRAGLVRDATQYRWSSAAAHAGVRPYPKFLNAGVFASMYTSEEWCEILKAGMDEKDAADLRRATLLGTVSGSSEFIHELERKYGMTLERRPPGRPRKGVATISTVAGGA
jgi:putative transposase